MHAVSGVTCVDAWKNAVALITSDRHNLQNLIVEISDPTAFSEGWVTLYDPRQFGSKYDRIRDVINTVFPMRLATRCPRRSDLYSTYLEYHRRGARKPKNRSRWGTYFQRLVDFDGSDTNQLEWAIQALSTWSRKEAAIVFHLSAPNIDGIRPRGGPCWHFGEILWNEDDTLDLMVVYRNHDYFNKALGNYLALGQLLRFICDAVGKRPGQLVCHSVHVYRSTTNTLLQSLASR